MSAFSSPVRTLLWVTLAAAVAVFCVVQDRVTAHGAREYVRLQRAALAGRGAPVTIDHVVRPAVSRSVRLGLLSSAAVAAAGGAAALLLQRRSGRIGGRVAKRSMPHA